MILRTFTQRGLSMPDAMRVLMAVLYASKRTNAPVEAILSPSRSQHIAHARKLAMHTAAEMRVSLADIGRAMDRDHTTVIAAVRCIKARRAQ